MNAVSKNLLVVTQHGILLVFFLWSTMSQAQSDFHPQVFTAADIDSLRSAAQNSGTSPLQRVTAHALLADIYSRLENIDSSIIHKNFALQYLHTINDRDALEEGYLRLATAYLPDVGRDSLILEAISFVKNPRRLATLFLFLDERYYANDMDYDTDDCIVVLDSAKYHLDRIDGEPGDLEISYLSQRADCYLLRHHHMMALESLLEAQSKLKPESQDASTIYAQLSIVYNDVRAYDQAYEAGVHAKELALANQEYFESMHAINQINRALFSQKKYQEIKRFSNEALDIESKNPGTFPRFAYTSLGRVALLEGKLDSAKYFFEMAVNMAGPPSFLASSDAREGLSEIAAMRGDMEEAKRQAHLAVEAHPWVDIDVRGRSKRIAELYGAEKNYAVAYRYLKEEVELLEGRDSLAHPYEIISRLMTENFEQEKTALNTQIELQKRIGRQRLFIGLGATLLTVLLLFLNYDRRRKNRTTERLQKMVSDQTTEITEQRDRLKQLDVFKSRFITNITHEFRTPLTVISGMADRIADENESKELIKRNSNQLLNLVNQMLDLRKLESGKLVVDKMQGDVVRHLRYLTESIKSYAEQKDLTVHFLSDQEELIMDFDQEKLTRIHSNLISNAIKFTPPGGNIYVQISHEGQEFIMKVKDTGIGISEDQKTHIFERFYQVDDSSTRQGEGTGIGLTLVHELIRAMEGDIAVSSTMGSGTTFIIRLPITNEAELMGTSEPELPELLPLAGALTSADFAVSADQELPGYTSENPTVLLIEDNPDVIHYLISCLRDHFSIEIAMNGAEGIDNAIEHVPDLIVSDVMMPIKDGFEVCQTLKNDERTSHIPIVLLTAKADIESRLEGLERGADAYLSKPFHQEELLATLKNQLELRRKLQVAFAAPVDREVPQVLIEEAPELKVDVEDAFLGKIRDVIEADLSNGEIDMPRLMRAIGMSRSQIYKKVKALTGKSPSIYIRSIRLHHAKEMLQKGELNVSEVAYDTGFNSPVHFSNAFLEEFGVRPNEVRDLRRDS